MGIRGQGLSAVHFLTRRAHQDNDWRLPTPRSINGRESRRCRLCEKPVLITRAPRARWMCTHAVNDRHYHKIQQKISSGEVDQNALMGEATNMLNMINPNMADTLNKMKADLDISRTMMSAQSGIWTIGLVIVVLLVIKETSNR